jgi:hypothetical protein
MAAADAVGRKSAFRRGLNATRLAVASAVTVLIVLIVAYAVTVVTRTEELSLSVTGGIIYVTQESVQPRKVGLTFSVQANNPSGRARFYYTGLRGLVFPVNNRTRKPIANFSHGMKDMVVAPNSLLQTDALVHLDDIPLIAPYFDELYNSSSASIFSNAMLTLNGTLDVRLYSGAQEVQCPDGLLLLAAHHGRRWQRLRAGHG